MFGNMAYVAIINWLDEDDTVRFGAQTESKIGHFDFKPNWDTSLQRELT